MEYTVLEQPQPPEQGPEEATPKCAQPKQAKPKREKPVQANPAQLNTKEQKKEITKNVSNPIRTADEREQYRDLIRENIEYDILAKNNPADRIRLDELVELMLDTVCSKRSSIRIAGDEFPTEVVKSRFLKLEAQHIQYVLDSLKDNPPHIRNIKKYLLAALYNAPLTIENYYAAQIIVTCTNWARSLASRAVPAIPCGRMPTSWTSASGRWSSYPSTTLTRWSSWKLTEKPCNQKLGSCRQSVSNCPKPMMYNRSMNRSTPP